MNIRMSDKEGFAALVLRLRAEGISNADLLTAVEKTPRGLFAPPAFVEAAYSTRSIPIECGEVMEGVDLSLQMLYLLDLKPGQMVLEVGTGSGFTAAVMAHLVDWVVTVDRFRTLSQLASQRIAHLGLDNVVVATGDGRNWKDEKGTFDRILVSAAFSEMPRTFAERLVSGGRMITAIGPGRRAANARVSHEDRQPVRTGGPVHGSLPALARRQDRRFVDGREWPQNQQNQNSTLTAQ